MAPVTTAGQDNEHSPPAGRPFGPHRWNLQVAATALVEAWNYNLSREELYGAIFAAEYATGDHWSLGVETQLTRVTQRTRDALMMGAAARVRRWFTLRPALSVVGEAALGVSYADVPVPPRGTRFNLTAQTGVGAACRITSRGYLQGGFRLFHLSNNSLAGRDRNPDIQAVGAYLGMLVPF